MKDNVKWEKAKNKNLKLGIEKRTRQSIQRKKGILVLYKHVCI